MSAILTSEEIADLTRRIRPAWQARELEHLGIAHKRRSDGTILVFWDDVRQKQHEPPKKREPQLRMIYPRIK